MIPGRGNGFLFSSLLHPDLFWTLLSLLRLRVKWLGHEADHSPPSGATVKNMWSYISIPPCVFMVYGVVLS